MKNVREKREKKRKEEEEEIPEGLNSDYWKWFPIKEDNEESQAVSMKLN